MTAKPPVIFARSVRGQLGADFEPDFSLVRDFQFWILDLVRGFSTRLPLFILFILFILIVKIAENPQNRVLKKFILLI